MNRILSVVATASLGAAGLALGGAPEAGASPAPVPLFSSTTPGFTAGAAIVLANVCGVTVTVDGAPGGDATAGPSTGTGGAGASVTADLPVTPGQVLDVEVGGAGGASTNLASGAGGGGGGDNAAGGGGASVVSSGGTPVVVAGGGGGAEPFGPSDGGAGGTSATHWAGGAGSGGDPGGGGGGS